MLIFLFETISWLNSWRKHDLFLSAYQVNTNDWIMFLFQHLLPQWAKQHCIDVELDEFPKEEVKSFFHVFWSFVSLDNWLKMHKWDTKCSMPTCERILVQFSLSFSIPLSFTIYFICICFASLCVGKNHNGETELLLRLVLNQCLGKKLASFLTKW